MIDRPKDISGNKASMYFVILHVLKKIDTMNKIKYVVLLQPTSPIRKINWVLKGIEILNRNSKFENLMYVNPEAQINEKEFKVKIGNNYFIKEIGVNVFDENAKIAYPLYKLSKSSMKIWMKEIDNYIQQDKTNLYGEDAFNNISDKINLMPMYTTDFCMEIDDHEDLLEAKKYYEKNGLK